MAVLRFLLVQRTEDEIKGGGANLITIRTVNSRDNFSDYYLVNRSVISTLAGKSLD